MTLGQSETFINQYFSEVEEIANKLDVETLTNMVIGLAELRAAGGRLFFLGVGGSAANASHAVNDFRKQCEIESYSFDNIAEMTARINDEGWEASYFRWLEGSHLKPKDAIFILSVGGGNPEAKVSLNLVMAVRHAVHKKVPVYAIVSRDGGFVAANSNCCVKIPVIDPDRVTPHAEEFQSVLLHMLVSHPLLKINQTKWEEVEWHR